MNEATTPTFWQVARRGKWVWGLIIALIVTGIFAYLGRWQLERSIDASRVVGPDTELAVPLRDLATPQMGVGSEVAWRRVAVDLAIVPGDTILLANRVNTDSTGWWVVGHGVDADGVTLAVAAGWAATQEEAIAAAATLDAAADLGEVTGRYLPPESPQQSNFETGVRSALATAELVNDDARRSRAHDRRPHAGA